MFPEMRRARQLLSREETIAILENGTSGTLALLGDDGYPYAVPMSYCYHDGKLLFHCAIRGHKLNAIERCDKASFCVVGRDDVVPERYTTHYTSVIAFGTIRVLKDGPEMRRAVNLIAQKYRPGFEDERRAEIDKMAPAMLALEMTIEHMTGKECIELTLARRRPQ